MSKIKGERGQEGFPGGWDIAATLGRLAVAFMIERGAPAKGAESALQPEERRPIPARLAAEDDDRGRDAASPSTSPRKGGKTSSGACTAT